MKYWLLICFFLPSSLYRLYGQPATDEHVLQEVKQHFNRCETFLDNRQFDSAAVVLKWTFDLAKQKLNQDHPLTADIAHALGYVSMVRQQPADAIVYYQEALRIRDLIYASPDASLAFTHNALGILYESTGEHDKAEKHFLEARSQWAGSVGKDHLRYSWAQHNLGRLYNKTGRHEEAVECLNDALRVKQLNLPPDDPDLGHSLVPLSASLFELGDFTAYEAISTRAIPIWKKQKGTNDLLYYWSLHNQTNLQVNLGNYTMAKSLGHQAVKGKISILGAEHLDVALSLITLATIFSKESQPDSAHYYLMRAAAIYEKKAPHSMEYARVQGQLGLHASSQGHYDQALAFLTASLELKKQLIGTENTEYSTSVLHFIRLLIQMNQFDTAHQLVQQQKWFYEKNDITRHANYSICLDLLGHVQIALEDKRAALQTYQLVNRINRETASFVSGIASENEFFSFVKMTEYYLDKYVSIAQLAHEIPEADIMDVSNQILWNRSFLLNKYTEARNQVQWDSSSLRLYKEMAIQRKKLFVQQGRLPSERLDVKDLERKIISLENELAQHVRVNTRPLVSTAAIQNVLKTGEIAIEFFNYTYYMPGNRDSVLYGAILISPDVVNPVILSLFEARQLMQFVVDTLQYRSDFANLIYSEHGANLYNLIWKPLLPYLEGVRTIYYSTSGLMHRINFNALPVDQDRILADEYNLVRMITTGQLLLEAPKVSSNVSCALMGGILYTPDTTVSDPHFKPKESMALAMYGEPDELNTDTSLRGEDWKYLNGSGEEIDRIMRIMEKAGFKITSWTENEATEEEFKNFSRTEARMNSPRVIHLSTHGYFYPDPIRQAQTSWTGDRGHHIQSADNPMIRSGLILAGGNYAWQYGKPPQPWMEDGILTAYEISTLDLSDTELVVLSACETGLGDIEGNEGVYGLQRALKIAGVQHIIMSLWQVPDAATTELMQRFYTHWLTKRNSLREALQRAQLEMRKEGFDPIEWAGFILVE